MKTISITPETLEGLEKIISSTTIIRTDCDLYRYGYRNKDMILKRICHDSTYDNQLYTIELLNANREYLPDNFVIPELLVTLDKQISFFAMPYVSGINLSRVLKSQNISVEEKKYHLKLIGSILEKLKYIRTHTPLKDFFIGDLHEDNFIIDLSQKEMYVIDLDGSKIEDNSSPLAKYLTSPTLLDFAGKKYQTNIENTFLVNYRTDENTDLYCYIIIILNYLYNGRIDKVDPQEFYNFLNYLSDININKNLLECFSQILADSPNENPIDYIDSLTSEQVYKARTLYIKKGINRGL